MIKGTNTEIADTQYKSVVRASMPAALARWEQKIAHCGTPRLLPTRDEQTEQLYCFGYCDAIYDLMIGAVTIKSVGIDPEVAE